MLLNLPEIKNDILNKVLLYTVIFAVLPFTTSILRAVEFGWLQINWYHTIIFVGLLCLFFLRHKLNFIVKLNIHAMFFTAISIVGIIYYGFTGGAYYCFIPILVNGILRGKKHAWIYFSIITVLYMPVAHLYISGAISPAVDLNTYHSTPQAWLLFYVGILFIAFLILIVSTNLFEYFLESLAEKDTATNIMLNKQDQLQHIFDNSPALMFLLDSNLEIININKTALLFANTTLEEVVSNKTGDVFRCIHSLKSDNGCSFSSKCQKCVIRNTIWKTLNEQKSYRNVEADLTVMEHGKEASYVFLLSTSTILDTSTKNILVTFENITKVRKAEADLRETETRLSSILANLPSVVYRCRSDDNWTMLMISPQIEELTGYPMFDFVDNSTRSYRSIIHSEDIAYVKAMITAQLRNGYTFELEYRIKHSNATERWVYEKGTVLKRDGDNYILDGIITDITHKKEIEFELTEHRENLERLVKERTEELATTNEELNATNEELWEKSKVIQEKNEELHKTLEELKETQTQLFQSEKMASLGILTAGIAHEINNPLNYIVGGIKGLEYLLKDHQLRENERASTLMNGILEGVDRASAIVRGLNQFSRDNEDYNEMCEIPSIIDNCLVMLNNQLKHKIEVIKDYPSKGGKVLGNVGKLHQVFLNLLTNSIQAIENKGTIKIEIHDRDNHVSVTISDSGLGIPSHNLNRITDPFFTTKEPGAGTGLGLSVSYSIIKKLKGEMIFDSEEGKGTVVKISIPTSIEIV